jgi:hypothetical protein
MASWLTGENMLSQILGKGKNIKSSILSQSEKVGDFIKNAANSGGEKWRESSTLTKVCIIGPVTGVAASLAIVPILGLVGFTSAGVAAGSIAASMQTATTVSGSLFALCQSAGAVGAVATSTSVGVGLAAGATASGITAAVCRKKPSSPSNDDEGQAASEAEEDIEEREGVEAREDVEESESVEEREDI